jgi:hypothetical protein
LVGLFAVSFVLKIKQKDAATIPHANPILFIKYLTATGCPPLNLKSHANPILRILTAKII